MNCDGNYFRKMAFEVFYEDFIIFLKALFSRIIQSLENSLVEISTLR